MHADEVSAPRKVMLFIPHLEQGGAERQILELMRHLPARYEACLCVYDGSDLATAHYRDYLPPGARTISLGVDRMGPRGLRRLVRIIEEERPAILHSYRDKANLWARLAAMCVDIPVVLTSVRNRFQGVFYGTAEFLLQHKSDVVVTNSRGIEQELIHWSRVAPERIQVVNNFVDLDRWQPPTDDERAAARAQFGFSADDVVLLLPGRLAMQKHQLGLAVALAYLHRRGRLAQNVRVVLAGRRRDKLYAELVPRGMKWLGVDDHVVFLEPQSEMLPLYHAADALVMPSLFEGMPNAVLEAHATTLPAVVTHAANRDGIVIDGVTGFEVPTLDPIALARGIESMIALSPERRREMGARGRAHVAGAFHPDRVLSETVKLYDELLANKRVS